MTIELIIAIIGVCIVVPFGIWAIINIGDVRGDLKKKPDNNTDKPNS